MEKLNSKTDGSSKDIVKENIEKLKHIFPDVFSEEKVDFDKLKEVMGSYAEDKEERYNFTWYGKSQARRIAQTPSTGTLRPCKEESKNWDKTQNLFIEGDNLEVLKLLQKSYHKRVKMIYIDPPYNTGNEFIYPDNYKDNLDTYLKYTGQKDSDGYKFSTNTETTGRYHTNWLNMMYPRLKLAKNLLKSNGAIFIQIDDNETSNLRRICDEIFGEENFICTLCVQMSYVSGEKMAHIDRKPPKIKEYIHLYAKNKSELRLNPQYRPREISPEYNKFLMKNDSDSPRDWKVVALSSHLKLLGIAEERDIDEFKFKNAHLIFNRVRSKNEEFLATRNIEHPVKITTKTGLEKLAWHGREVIFLSSKISRDKNGAFVYLEALGDIWNDINITNIYQEGGVDFKNGKKPIKLITRLIDYVSDEDSICLDFFAGSATSAHAVMNHNVENGRKRKFIMIQLPEQLDKKNTEQKSAYHFCVSNDLPPNVSDIGKERIRRAGDKILEENKDKDGIKDLDVGFKVFKLDSSNIKSWDGDFDNLDQALFDAVHNIKDERTEDDVLYEILLKYGLDLTLPIEERKIADKTVYSIGFGALVICLDSKITIDVVEGIGKLKEELKPEVMRVVFKDNGFEDDVIKTNAIQALKQYSIEDVKSL
jgi:adenine-specific DNA-methyltransferase